MSQIKFGHVFFGLMALSFVSAFLIAPAITNRGRSQVQNIFAPVAYPARKIGSAFHARLARPHPRDDGSPNNPRSSAELIRENTQLRVTVTNLQGQLERLATIEGERAAFGEIRKLCTPFRVIGGDSGTADSLMITGSSFNGLKEGMPVLYLGGIAGKISRAGAGGAQVMLVTDKRFGAEAIFIPSGRQANGINQPPAARERVLIEGAGDGKMIARMTKKAAADVGVKENDWAILDDPEWNQDWPALRAYRLGYVTRVAPSRNPGFIDIELRPDQRLMTLEEVMVMNK